MFKTILWVFRFHLEYDEALRSTIGQLLQQLSPENQRLWTLVSLWFLTGTTSREISHTTTKTIKRYFIIIYTVNS